MLIKRFLSLFLLLILPTLAMQRMHEPSLRLPMPQLQKSRPITWQGTNTPWRSKTFKYDDILTFLNDLESGELEKRCTDQDLEQINHFIADLAREGVIPNCGNDPHELEYDIEELLGISDPYSFRYAPAERSSYELTPALYYGHHETLTCGWFKKAWKKTKKFCKKHKKAIIIGAAVAVVVSYSSCGSRSCLIFRSCWRSCCGRCRRWRRWRSRRRTCSCWRGGCWCRRFEEIRRSAFDNPWCKRCDYESP